MVDSVHMVDNMDMVDNVNMVESIDIMNMPKSFGYLWLLVYPSGKGGFIRHGCHCGQHSHDIVTMKKKWTKLILNQTDLMELNWPQLAMFALNRPQLGN